MDSVSWPESQPVCLSAGLSLSHTHTILGTGNEGKRDPVQLLTSCATRGNPGSLGFSFCTMRGQVGEFESLLRLGISTRY